MARRSWIPAAVAIAVSALAAAYFAPLGDFVAADPLPGQEWMKEHTGAALGAFALVLLVAGALAWPPGTRATTAATDQAFDPRTDGYFDEIRGTMKVACTELLSESLSQIVPARLGVAERRDAISSPLRVIGTPDPVTGIVEVFEDPRTARRLLVLGDPGAGKTTQLLRLAEHLLENADGPVPILVPLSGSGWHVDPYKPNGLRSASAQIDLAVDTAVKWLASEIGRLYQLPPKRVERWLRADRSPVVLLLDGLDEIRDPDERRRCVQVLSLLRSRLNTGMVVCSRTTEYFESDSKLTFGTAAEILPLRPEYVDVYLAEAGDELASLRSACRHNPALAQLLATPLTLTVAVRTYRGKQVDESAVRALTDNRLDHLWSAYLDEVLSRRRSLTNTVRHSPEETLRCARNLAGLLESAGRDSFRLDALNLSWLGPELKVSRRLLVLYGTLAALCCGVLCGLAWRFEGFAVGAATAGVFLLGVLLANVTKPDFVSTRWWLNWAVARSAAVRLSVSGLVVWVIFTKLNGDSASLESRDFLLGLTPGLVAGLTAAVMALPFPAIDRTAATDHRISAAHRTLRVRLAAGFISLTTLIAAPWIIGAVAEPLPPALLYITIAASAGCWLVGFAASMRSWWSHHTAWRAVIDNGLLPRDIEGFLAHTEERIITRRRLDGHAFLHRTLQSHLAGHSSEARTALQAR